MISILCLSILACSEQKKDSIAPILALVGANSASSAPGNSSSGGVTTNGGSGGTTISTHDTKVYDANNQFLGYGFPNAYSIQMVSPTGYFYSLGWDGIITDSYIKFTQINGGGVAFIDATGAPYAKFAERAGGSLYTAQQADVYGNAVSNPGITQYYSYYIAGSITNYPAGLTVGTSLKVFPLTTITKTVAGIPNTIALPIKVVYQ
ncbi:hypothetical protein LEP1GSC047_0802 [Leptospira inadai serovar Lyme str. 10]|uniref:Uncharacterized protein n=2 Tax=Leptospira inadai serovar Lyme TaxID=293084 RepID=V6HJS3_9LEPT|nr:hypothetical protein [Leptospira inadai]EQA37145.1 hypothetical protein LEP1GSC047_0802 [Leptospira inadai serovar Lyme str. 10]PNV76661.1 hypothetical protein BES34_003530 [Leptospira inadai serovar Lyme]